MLTSDDISRYWEDSNGDLLAVLEYLKYSCNKFTRTPTECDLFLSFLGDKNLTARDWRNVASIISVCFSSNNEDYWKYGKILCEKIESLGYYLDFFTHNIHRKDDDQLATITIQFGETFYTNKMHPDRAHRYGANIGIQSRKNTTNYVVLSKDNIFEIIALDDPNWSTITTVDGESAINYSFSIIWPVGERDLFVTKCTNCNNWRALHTECVACIREIIPTGELINSYNTRVETILQPIYSEEKDKESKYLKKNKLQLFGIEIELELDEPSYRDRDEDDDDDDYDESTKDALEAAKIIYKAQKKFTVIKRDGSINRGFEIVSAPATFNAQKEKWQPIFEAICKKTKLVEKQNCGIHIHVGRSTLTALQIGRMLEWLYNKDNKSLIVYVAGRESRDYSSLENVLGNNLYSEAPAYKNEGRNKYVALNLSPANTIEFRLFKSTTNYHEFCTYLEFVKSIIDYTKPGEVNVPSIFELKKQEYYLKYIRENRKEYPNLWERLEKGNFVKPISKKGVVV